MSEKKIRLAVFDVDGVLLDSMGIWQEVGDRLLEKYDIHLPEEERKKINTFTVERVAAYLNERYHLRDADEEIVREICGEVEEAYYHSIPAKPCLEETLRWLSVHGVKMCILTASEKYYVEAACRRLGLLRYFDYLYTCTELGLSKYDTALFEQVCREMGVLPQEAVMFEDSLHALTTAAKAGMCTVGVEDAPWNSENLPALREKADWFINDYRQIPECLQNAVD